MYSLQAMFVNPTIYSYWLRMKNTLLDQFRNIGKPICISGDGQYDSPGFTASYCFYSICESTTKKMIDFYVCEKSMTEYSAKMEAFSTKVLLRRLHRKNIDVRVITTDRSSQLKKLMQDVNREREQRGLQQIKHSYDVWHYVKCVSKDIFTASRLKRCQILSSWIRSIRNMMWYCFANCHGNADLLREMILSIPLHICGIHSFPENHLFSRCLHGDLPSDRTKPWLREGTLSHKKVVQAIRGNRDCRLKDLELMTEFQHTGVNEQINNLHNVYLPKSTFFGQEQAYVRGCLTGIDHNFNTDRQPALDVDGDERYNVVATRDGKLWTAKLVREPKDTSWRQEITDEVIQAVRCGAAPKVKIPTDNHYKRFGKKLPKPEKSIAMAATKESRRFREIRQQEDNL
jgi:hypothetical protein